MSFGTYLNLFELPNEYAKQIDTMIFHFSWSYKKTPSYFERANSNTKRTKAQRIKFIARLLNSEGEGSWKLLAE